MSIPGPATQIDLEDSSSVFGPAGEKPEGLTRSAACLSLELATVSYSLNTDPWQKAGWRDFSILADNDLLTGSALNGPAASPLEELSRGVRQTLTQMRLTMRDPVTQYLGFKRQQEENSSACKAVVFSRPCGSYVLIGISFKGTGKRLFDWIPNMRIRAEDGYHGGFSRIAGQFMEACSRIEFPETAKDLGLARLTLMDILAYMRNPSAPFRLWISGHSQGAAVMQVFIDRLVHSGVPKELISGVGFASPSVTENHRPDAGRLPIIHILNADDLIPRIGFTGHLGQCYLFVPDSREREELYRAEWNSPCFKEVLEYYRQAEDTDDALVLCLAALEMVGGQSSDTLHRVVSAADQLSILPDWLKPETEITIPGVKSLAGQIREQYGAVTGGKEVPEEELAAARARFGDMAARYGMTTWMMAAMRGITLPHRMYGNGREETAYKYIVTKHADELVLTDDPAAPDRAHHLTEDGGGTRRTSRLAAPGTMPAPAVFRRVYRPAVPGAVRRTGTPGKGKIRLTLPEGPEHIASAMTPSSDPKGSGKKRPPAHLTLNGEE